MAVYVAYALEEGIFRCHQALIWFRQCLCVFCIAYNNVAQRVFQALRLLHCVFFLPHEEGHCKFNQAAMAGGPLARGRCGTMSTGHSLGPLLTTP